MFGVFGEVCKRDLLPLNVLFHDKQGVPIYLYPDSSGNKQQNCLHELGDDTL